MPKEWEKAARGPYTWRYAYGQIHRRPAANVASGALRPVASYAASPYGLYDMTGNAMEWTADAFAPYPVQEVLLRA